MSNQCGQQRDALSSYLSKSQSAPPISPAEPTLTLEKQTSRKRKHSELVNRCVIGQSFSIQIHSCLPSPKAQELIPRVLLPRSCLPLAYLDLTGSAEEWSAPTLFSAHIEILEENKEADQCPEVLIAESAANGRLHAVEKVHTGLYALCRLGSWVDLHALRQLHNPVLKYGLPQKKSFQGQLTVSSGEWWRPAAIKPDLQSRQNEDAMPRLKDSLRARLCLQRPAQEDRAPSSAIPKVPRLTTPEWNELALDGDMVQTKQEFNDVYGMIRLQYREALYASKASLAYFAKGPLSRARAAFNANDGSAHDQSKLIQFLRTNILVLATMDTKYRETLPDLIKDLPFGILSEDEGEPVIAAISKKFRKSKKMAIGKNGLYPGEELNIARWWLSRDVSSMACDTAEAREEVTRTALLEQRAKETQMQIILVLETLSLEASAPVLSGEQDLPQQIAPKDEVSQKKTKKPKKQQNLVMLLDLLADRLSIWQSMSVDEANNNDEKKAPSPRTSTNFADNSTGNRPLRQFCVDVLLPFYAARLPELTSLLCQKLGGPKQPSPRRAPLARATTFSTSVQPGAAVQRVQARKPRRTLERVLTDERSASQRPPSLSRSATEPTLPKLKREVSDVSLSSIPLNRIAMHKRYSQREVDLKAASQATESKISKKAKIDQELHSAIAALKKPNPRMAVKELVEDAEKRAAGSHPKKPRNPTRNPFAQGVQIMATPSNTRHKDVFGGLPRLPRAIAVAPSPILEEIPPSSISRIIDSPKRRPGLSSAVVKDSLRKDRSRFTSSIDQTPTRGPLKYVGRPSTSFDIESTTEDILLLQSTALFQSMSPASPVTDLSLLCRQPLLPLPAHKTPTKHRAHDGADQAAALGIEATPIQLSRVAPTSEKPLKPTASPQAQEAPMSIYASLGWDDEVDELS